MQRWRAAALLLGLLPVARSSQESSELAGVLKPKAGIPLASGGGLTRAAEARMVQRMIATMVWASRRGRAERMVRL